MTSADVIDISTRLNTAMKAPPAPGVYENIPEHDYLSWWPCASNSRLSDIGRSPAHLMARLREGDKDTDAKRFGRASHCAILEPDNFGTRYLQAEQCGAIKKGDGKRCTNAGAFFDQKVGWRCGVHGKDVPFNDVHPDAVLSPTDYERCERIRDAFYAHPLAAAVLRAPGPHEVTVVWNDAETGVPCKARFDKLTFIADGTIWDLKSCEDARRDAFERSIYNYGYHRQGALYLDGAAAHQMAIRNYGVIAYEKEPPYALIVYRLDEGALDAGEKQLRPRFRQFRRCLERNEWPAYEQDVVADVALPAWAWAQIDQETQGEGA